MASNPLLSLALAGLLLSALPGQAQHQGHQLPAPHDHAAMMGDSAAVSADGPPAMSHAYSRHLPMNRNGSGTAWNPDQTPLYMWMNHRGPWMIMNHGAIYPRFSTQNVNRSPGQRGGRTVDAPNWFMTMAQRPVGAQGLLSFTAMFSLDAVTSGAGGYPLLFQSGEAYQGRPLVDR